MLFMSYGDDSEILSRLPTNHKVKSNCSVILYSIASVNPAMILYSFVILSFLSLPLYFVVYKIPGLTLVVNRSFNNFKLP